MKTNPHAKTVPGGRKAGRPRRWGKTCPNAAAPGYFEEKLLDLLTSAAAGMGLVTILLFLITM